jgi:hypothetical protein
MKHSLRLIAIILFAAAACAAQESAPYWSPARIWETSAVTALHVADSAETCYHLARGAQEEGLGTPHNCAGATAYIVGSGPVLQWASHRMVRHYPGSHAWRVVERALPYVEISISINAMRCSSAGRCGRDGF